MAVIKYVHDDALFDMMDKLWNPKKNHLLTEFNPTGGCWGVQRSQDDMRNGLFATYCAPSKLKSTCFKGSQREKKGFFHGATSSGPIWNFFFTPLHTDAIVRDVRTQGQIVFHWHNHSRTYWIQRAHYNISLFFFSFLPWAAYLFHPPSDLKGMSGMRYHPVMSQCAFVL